MCATKRFVSGLVVDRSLWLDGTGRIVADADPTMAALSPFSPPPSRILENSTNRLVLAAQLTSKKDHHVKTIKRRPTRQRRPAQTSGPKRAYGSLGWILTNQNVMRNCDTAACATALRILHSYY
jgi:hypothetical protein